MYAWPLFCFHLTVPSFGKCGSEGSPLPTSIVLAVGQTMRSTLGSHLLGSCYLEAGDIIALLCWRKAGAAEPCLVLIWVALSGRETARASWSFLDLSFLLQFRFSAARHCFPMRFLGQIRVQKQCVLKWTVYSPGGVISVFLYLVQLGSFS